LKTIKLHIKKCDDFDFILNKKQNYSYAFRICYRYFNLIDDIDFSKNIKERYNMTDIEYRSLKNEVSSFVSKTAKNKEKTEEKIVTITEKINKIKNLKEKSKKDLRKLYKLNKKLSYHNKSLGKDVCFGDKRTLRKISEYNNIINNYSEKYEHPKSYYENLLIENKKKYTKSRVKCFFILGEANQKGNRFFDFNFEKNEIIYKPYKGKKIKFEIKIFRNNKKDIEKLIPMIKNKLISVSATINENTINIVVDNEKLNGYSIDVQSRKKEVDNIKKSHIDKEVIHNKIIEVYKKYHRELEDKKLINKKQDRCLSIDLNPNYIGCSILDKLHDGEVKIIKTFDYDLSELNKKLPKEATKEQRKKLNNLRKHTISNIVKSLKNEMLYYKCSNLILEELDFKIDYKDKSKEANRLTKNVWCRNLFEAIFDKYCQELGFIKILVNPVYSSFIGNIKYDYVDWVNASIEIGRRGLYKYDKGYFYPKISYDDVNAVKALIGADDSLFSCKDTWKAIHKVVLDSGRRYRRETTQRNKIVSSKHSYGKEIKVYSNIYH
jgi:hypothetical protein